MTAEHIRVRDARKPGWFWIDNDLLDQHGAIIGPHGIAVYAALARFADSRGECYPATTTIARITGLSRATVSTTLAALVDRRIVAVTHTAGRVNVYHLLSFPQPVDKPVNVVDRLGGDLSTTLTGVVNVVDRGRQRGRQGLSTTLTGVVNHVDANKTKLTRPIEQDPTKDDDEPPSSSSSSPAPSWESLESQYGPDMVRRAIDAAPDVKRTSVRYIAGILKNWTREGTARRVKPARSDPYA